ncbi:MAG: SIMPL domain-containing protein [Chromatiales bacterium]|nr:SIMPL domain-containing protein [Chromatiales bacterium]
MGAENRQGPAGVEVRTGGYRTYPVYDKDKIRRWRATQELQLEGTDFARMGALIGQLQERLQVSAINFSVVAGTAGGRRGRDDRAGSRRLPAARRARSASRSGPRATGWWMYRSTPPTLGRCR